MAYIGYKKAASSTVVSKTLATMTGDGTDNTLTLLATPGSVNNVSVFLDGVFQTPGVHFTLAGNVITFTTAPASNVVVIALTGGGEHIGSPMAGSIKTDDLGVGAVTSSKIASMDAAKLTGTYPALDASAVTGLTSANLTGTFGALNASAVTGLTSANLTGTLPAISGAALTGVPSAFTESANDPATNTNPAGGLGTIWVNTTSGEMYACTDATADNNVWTNVGAGTGNIEPWQYGGTIAGYTMGGYNLPSTHGSHIHRIDFITDGNATHPASLGGEARHNSAGASSTTHGYASGGGRNEPYPGPWTSEHRDKYQFGTGTNSVRTVDLPNKRSAPIGNSNDTHGFICGGNFNAAGASNVIEKFSFANESDTADHGDLSTNRGSGAPSQTKTHGFCSHSVPNTAVNLIDKYSMASNVTAVDWGNLSVQRYDGCGHSSQAYGYFSGGGKPTHAGVTIDKFSFASGGASSDHGDLAVGRNNAAGNNSMTHGYVSGGDISNTDRMDKFSMAANVTSSYIGTLTIPIAYFGGPCNY